LHRVVDGAGGNAGVAEDLHDLGLGATLGELTEDAIDLVVVGPAPLRRVEALVADELLPADRLQPPVPVPVARPGGVDEAVVVEASALALVEAARGRRAERAAIAGAHRGLAAGGLARERDAAEVDHGILHGDLDLLAATGPLTLMQGGQDTDGAV